jgi:hypothetical protein
MTQALLGARDGFVQARDLVVNVLVGDDAMPDIRHLPPEEVHVSDDDARRCRNTLDLTLHYFSPNLF